VKARLEALDRKGLVSLLGDLYDANVANRRFLHSRLTPGSRDIEEYRRLVADAIYPDPFSTRRVRVRDAAAAIVEYRRSTGDASGDRRPHADVRRGWNGASCRSGLRRRDLLRRAADSAGRRGEGVRHVARGRTRERENPSGPDPGACARRRLDAGCASVERVHQFVPPSASRRAATPIRRRTRKSAGRRRCCSCRICRRAGRPSMDRACADRH